MNGEMTTQPNGSRSEEIHLLGQRMVVKCSNTDPEVASEVIELVSARVLEAEKRVKGKSVAPHQVMLLALLDLAEEYLEAKRRTAQYQGEVESRARGLVDLLNPPAEEISKK